MALSKNTAVFARTQIRFFTQNSSYSTEGWGGDDADDLGLDDDQDDWGGDWNEPTAATTKKKTATFSTKKPAKKATLGAKGRFILGRHHVTRISRLLETPREIFCVGGPKLGLPITSFA